MEANKRDWDIRDDDTIYETMRMYRLLDAEFSQFNREMTENYNITVASMQWDAEIKSKLNNANRPAFSYNLIRTIINVLIGIEKDNRKSIITTARGTEDIEMSNIMNKVLKYYMYHSGLSSAQRRVFYDKIIARLGVYHIGWEYDGSDDEYGKLFIKATDPRELRWDATYDDKHWERASYVMRRHKLTIEEIINTYALKDDELRQAIQMEANVFYKDDNKGKWISRKLKQIFEAVYETALANTLQSNISNRGDSDIWWDAGSNRFDVLELHEKRTRNSILIRLSGQNELVDITDEYIKQYQKLTQKIYDGYTIDNEILGIIKRDYNLQGEYESELVRQRYVTAVCPAFRLKLNEQPYPVNSKYYVYIPDYCYDVHVDNLKVQSVVDDIKDVQQDFNKARSLILELIGRYAARGYMVDENAIKGYEDDWLDNAIGRFKRIRSGYFGLVRQEDMMQINSELMRLPYETQQLIKVITNADDEVRGVKSPGVTSGRHFLAKEQRQAKSFTIILENRDESLKALYHIALNFIQKYVSTQQVIRITNEIDNLIQKPETIHINQRQFVKDENGNYVVKIVNDITAIDYDVEISEEQYSASAQEERYYKLSEIFNAVIKLNPKKAELMLPVIIKNIGLREADKIIELWEGMEQNQSANPQMDVAQQLSMIMAKLGIENKKAELQGKQLDNVKKEFELRQQNALSNMLQQKQGANGNEFPGYGLPISN